MGASIGVAANILDPKRIVIGGSLGTTATYFRRLTASIRASIYAEDTRQLLIDRSQLGPDAAALGAAMVAIDHLHELES